MGRFLKLSILTALLAAALLPFACGKGKHSAATLPSAGSGGLQAAETTIIGSGGFPTADSPPAEQSLNEVLTDLEALPCPEGVGEALWSELKGALEEALHSAGSAGVPPVIQEVGGRDARATKITASPPTGEANRVNDLSLVDNGDGTFTLRWHYRNLGDYNQDGVVAISDITPLAQHFGETVPEDDLNRNSIQAVIDGSGNGKVDIADITPIAQCFGIEVADYLIEGATALEGPFSEMEAVSVSEATGAETGRAVIEHIFTPGEYSYFRVTARDAAGNPGEPSNTVGRALQILSVSPTEVKEGTVVTFSAEVLGAGPLSYEWDFGGGAQYETYTEPSPRVVLTRETGNFPATLTVTGPLGDATYPFTLTKLAREWKYEVVLTDQSISGAWPQMKIAEDEVWIHTGEDVLSPPPVENIVVHGRPGTWERENVSFKGALALNSAGSPGIAKGAGPLLDETLKLAERGAGGWTITELEHAMAFTRVSLVYASGNEPLITFSFPSGDSLEYFWRKGEDWERGIVDEPGDVSGYGLTGVEATTDAEGNPILCYSADVFADPYTYTPLRVAWWRPSSEYWEVIQVEGGPEDVNLGATGYFPALDFRPDGKLAVVYARVSPEIEGVRYNQLAYAVYDGTLWEKELLEELPYVPYSRSYGRTSLAHDATGEPVIAITDTRDENYGLKLLWRCQGIWYMEMLTTGQGSGQNPSLASDAAGNVCVAYYNSGTKEVMIGIYE